MEFKACEMKFSTEEFLRCIEVSGFKLKKAISSEYVIKIEKKWETNKSDAIKIKLIRIKNYY